MSINSIFSLRFLTKSIPRSFTQVCHLQPLKLSLCIRSLSTAMPTEKKVIKKKKKVDNDVWKKGFYKVTAYSTAEEYDLDDVANKLKNDDVFELTTLAKELGLKNNSFLHAKITQPTRESESREIYIFKEGSVVAWNVAEIDVEVILSLLSKHQVGGYSNAIVRDEGEQMNYGYLPSGEATQIVEDDIMLSSEAESLNDKFAVSNAMALSVKLGAWESILENYINSMADVTADVKLGNKIKMTQAEVMRKTGELLALRHSINLSSDLLDTPDIYWDREKLEKVYQLTATYFCITKRTKVMNEKISHCIELVELLSSHLSDNHHVRLEWMIIILIMVEVAFEALRHIEDKWSHKPTTTDSPEN